jgi:hypothetical protein
LTAATGLVLSYLTNNIKRFKKILNNRLRMGYISYETTPKWHGFLMIKLAVLAAGVRAEQRTAEYRITNFEGLNRCALSIVFIVIDRIPSFDIRYSLF